jgi:putative membrane protein
MLGYVSMHNMGWGWAVLMTIAWLAILGLLVGAVLTRMRDRSSASPREILDRRLAAGEIDLDQYESARAAMSREGPGGSPMTTSAATQKGGYHVRT